MNAGRAGQRPADTYPCTPRVASAGGMGTRLILRTPACSLHLLCACHSTAAVLARVPRFRSQLAAWLQRGLGTQPVSSPLAAPADGTADRMDGVAKNVRARLASIRWEASLFGREGRWAEAAAAIGARWGLLAACHASSLLLGQGLAVTISACRRAFPCACAGQAPVHTSRAAPPCRWYQGALPVAGAQLLLRHLDQRPGPHNACQLGGLPLVTSNERNGAAADVAISHARSGGAAAGSPASPRILTASCAHTSG